ncbi:plasmid SOS inhibition protein A [Providencia rettgeri]|uniref:Plasmid SOS inhibition protein A n=1 Tax=Providencia rettgeri TaxID=587 RepID=A0A939NGL1_PRORE|nr:plasmid SOS inhibition protein A [Providencia rettgeri]
MVAQAEIELAFHSPETVEAGMPAGVTGWRSMTRNAVLAVGERFPSLAGMERWQWQDMPFWQVIAEASLAARGRSCRP